MIHLKNISKVYRTKSGAFEAVRPTTLAIRKGEIFGIIGYSGAGKSTLLRMINLIETPTTGEVWFDGVELTSLDRKSLQKKRHEIGMIFQHFNLLLNKTVYGNIEFALKAAGVPKPERAKRIRDMLDIVELGDKAHHYPAQLSGGQKQRVAIARARPESEGAAVRRADVRPRSADDGEHPAVSEIDQRAIRGHARHRHA